MVNASQANQIADKTAQPTTGIVLPAKTHGPVTRATHTGVKLILTTEEYGRTETLRFPYDVTINDRRFVRVLSAFSFEVHDDFAIFSTYVVNDTRFLESVFEVLSSDSWTETELNAAVEALNA